MNIAVILISVGIVLVVASLLGVEIARLFLHKKMEKNQNHTIFRITIPKFSESGKQGEHQIRERLAQVENLYASLSSLRAEHGLHAYLYGRTDHFTLELVAENGIIAIYAALPAQLAGLFMQQVQSVYPHVQFDQVVDYNIFQPQAAILGGYLVFRRSFIFPIKTYKLFENDPLETLLTSLSKTPPDNGAAIQLVIRSASKSWHQPGRKVAEAVYKGSSVNEALKHQESRSGGMKIAVSILKMIIGVFGATFASAPKKKDESQRTPQQHQMSPKDQEVVKGIEEKTSKGGFDVNIRIVVSAQDRVRAETQLRNIMNSFGQYNIYEFGNAFKPLYVGSQDKIIQNFIFRHFEPRASVLLNTEELTSVFHLPERIQTPNVLWLKAKKAPPPVDMPREGILIGRAVYREQTIDVRMKDADRRRHVYIVGQTGTGKSKLIENMAIQDIQRGKGVCVIDPHGDLVEAVLSHIPKERADDVIIFDPSDTERPMGLNMLEFDTPEQKTFVINEMINIFDKLYDLRQTGGPMFEQYMRNTMLLMMEDPESGSTLLEVSKVLADEKFRRMKLSKAKNPVVKDFWEKEAQKAGGDAALANMVPYITSKLTQFIANDIMRPIISQQHSSFNFRKIMDEQKILLINLSKGKVGDMNSALLGMICVGKLLMASLSRVDLPDEQRKDFYLYIDEFQNFITESISIILSEARKYRLNLTVAHQYINQLVKNTNTSVRDAIFGNVGTVIAFRVGVDDAEIIARQFAPVFDQYDVINIEKYHCYVRLLIDNQNPPAFSCKPAVAPAGDRKLAQILKQLSRTKYGKPREVLEREIVERTTLPPAPENPLPRIA